MAHLQGRGATLTTAADVLAACCRPLLAGDVEVVEEVVVVTDDGKAGLGTVISKIHAAGICCPSEVPIIHRTLDRLPGIHSVEVNVVLKTVTVKHNAGQSPPGVVVDALNGARLQASLISGNRGEARKRRCWEQLPPWYLLLSGVCVVLSFMHYVPAVPAWFVYFGLVSVLLGVFPVLLKAWAAVRSLFVDINVLMLVATAGAIALRDYNEAGAIVFLFAIAEWLEVPLPPLAPYLLYIYIYIYPLSVCLSVSLYICMYMYILPVGCLVWKLLPHMCAH